MVKEPATKKQKVAAGPDKAEIHAWHAEQVRKHEAKTIALKQYEGGIELYGSFPFPKPLPFKTFMEKYLEAASVSTECATQGLLILDSSHELDDLKDKHANTEMAFKYCAGGISFYADMPDPKPLPFKSFMLSYLGSLCALDTIDLAHRMVHHDFKKYCYPNMQ